MAPRKAGSSPAMRGPDAGGSFILGKAGAGNGEFAVDPSPSGTTISAGNLYGTTAGDGAYQHGSVFKATFANGKWSYQSLHDFTGGSDGAYPYGTLSFDAAGNIYGTTSAGGAYGNGVVFQITQ